MKEESEGEDVHEEGLGKRKGFAHQAGYSLAQREVKAFDVVGLALLFGTASMSLSLEHLLVGGQQVAVTKGAFVAGGHLSPQVLAGRLVPVAPHPRHHLARSTTQHHPQPYHVLFASNERPQLVQFQHLLRLCGQQRGR